MSAYKDETGRNPIASRRRAERAEGALTQTDGEARSAWIEILRETHRAKPSRFLASLLNYHKRARGLPSPRQLDAVNACRERAGLPRAACRTSDPARRAQRAATWKVAANAGHAALAATRPMKPPGR